MVTAVPLLSFASRVEVEEALLRRLTQESQLAMVPCWVEVCVLPPMLALPELLPAPPEESCTYCLET